MIQVEKFIAENSNDLFYIPYGAAQFMFDAEDGGVADHFEIDHSTDFGSGLASAGASEVIEAILEKYDPEVILQKIKEANSQWDAEGFNPTIMMLTAQSKPTIAQRAAKTWHQVLAHLFPEARDEIRNSMSSSVRALEKYLEFELQFDMAWGPKSPMEP